MCIASHRQANPASSVVDFSSVASSEEVANEQIKQVAEKVTRSEMCEQVIKFCSGSSKLLLFAGSFLTLITGIAIAYIGCTSNALFNDIDPSVAQSKSLFHYFQLAAGLYLILVAFAGSVAAYYENKETIRVVSLDLLTMLNLLLMLSTNRMSNSCQC